MVLFLERGVFFLRHLDAGNGYNVIIAYMRLAFQSLPNYMCSLRALIVIVHYLSYPPVAYSIALGERRMILINATSVHGVICNA